MSHKIISTGEERTLKFDCENCDEKPDIAENSACMKEANVQLMENAKVNSIVLAGKYIQEYKNDDLDLLKEFSQSVEMSRYLIQRQITLDKCTDCKEEREKRIGKIWSRLKGSPSQGFEDLQQFEHEISENLSQGSEKCKDCRRTFLKNGIEPALENLSFLIHQKAIHIFQHTY